MVVSLAIIFFLQVNHYLLYLLVSMCVYVVNLIINYFNTLELVYLRYQNIVCASCNIRLQVTELCLVLPMLLQYYYLALHFTLFLI